MIDGLPTCHIRTTKSQARKGKFHEKKKNFYTWIITHLPTVTGSRTPKMLHLTIHMIRRNEGSKERREDVSQERIGGSKQQRVQPLSAFHYTAVISPQLNSTVPGMVARTVFMSCSCSPPDGLSIALRFAKHVDSLIGDGYDRWWLRLS